MLCGLNEQPLSLVRRSGRDADTFGEDNVLPDLDAVKAALVPRASVQSLSGPSGASQV